MTPFEQLYGTVLGYLTPENQLPGVKDVTGEGSAYDQAYQNILSARENLCRRFGLSPEDKDLEVIMSAVQALEKATAQGIFNACTEG